PSLSHDTSTTYIYTLSLHDALPILILHLDLDGYLIATHHQKTCHGLDHDMSLNFQSLYTLLLFPNHYLFVGRKQLGFLFPSLHLQHVYGGPIVLAYAKKGIYQKSYSNLLSVHGQFQLVLATNHPYSSHIANGWIAVNQLHVLVPIL